MEEEEGNKCSKNQVLTLCPLQNRESKHAMGEIILVKITGKKILARMTELIESQLHKGRKMC